MKLKTKSRIAALGTLSLALAGLIAGCELIVDIDRTKIDGGTIEGGGGDVVNQPDGTADTGKDGTTMDAPSDTTVQDTGIDSGVDTGADSPTDTGADVPDDTSPD